MTSQSQKALNDKGGRRKPVSQVYAKSRIQKRQKARNIRQLIDRVDYDKGAAISDKHIRQGAFNPAKVVKDLSPESIKMVESGQYDYMPSLYEQGVRRAKQGDVAMSDKHRTVKAGFDTAIRETIALRCAQIAAYQGGSVTAHAVYRRRRKLCHALLVGKHGMTREEATEYVHADTPGCDARIRDCLTEIVQAFQH